MARIDAASLYDEKNDVSWARPILQGDVFRDVELPGFSDGPYVVQVVAHPCAMRRGAEVAERVTVAPVHSYQLVSGSGW
ncbi:hypothetical protein ACWEPH_00615, partial [Nocardia beijingensis]